MSTSVCRALRHDGSLNAGTPLEMASTPVTAAPPEANACSTTYKPAPMRRPSPALPCGMFPSTKSPTTGRVPVLSFQNPMPSRTNMLTMKK